jgi:hypothetical protein
VIIESVEKCIDCDKKDMAVEACEMKLPVYIKSGDIQEHVLTGMMSSLIIYNISTLTKNKLGNVK